MTLELQRESRWHSILVSDTGIGIPTEEQEHIFQAFYRTSEARPMAERGTGLGLPIAESIAITHGGTITWKAPPARGAASNFRSLSTLRSRIPAKRSLF